MGHVSVQSPSHSSYGKTKDLLSPVHLKKCLRNLQLPERKESCRPMAYFKPLFCHVMALFFFFQTLSVTSFRGNHTDHQALLAIKSSITHDPQGILDTWNASHHFCQWQGVTCGRRHKRVTLLDLQSKGVSGSLSPQIGNLSFLREIRLSNNSLRGPIPPQLGRLFRLQKLSLINNSFEGEIPASLSNCTRLVELRIARNKLVGKLPRELTSLVNLMVLVIHVNRFTGGIPSFLGNLTSLVNISAFDNHLGGRVPHALGQLHDLQEIGFTANQLHGTIPPSLYNISSLAVIDFSDNRISGDLPRDIGLKLPNLQIFLMWGNQLTGSLPRSFSNCSSLMELHLAENRFTGKINIDFGQVPNLRFLGLFNNSLGSWESDEMNFIASMVNCSKVEKVTLHMNQLRGMLPNSVGNLSSQLTHLSFAKNNLHGPLPSGIGNLVSLEALSLQLNQFTGVIPSELGNLQNLNLLYLSRNNFTGNFPDSVGNLLMLLELSLSDNRLDGNIPTTLGNCRSLRSLVLSTNNLSGLIPNELFQLSSLSDLYLAQNHLVGTLPQEIGKLKRLSVLDLSQNDLAGAVPDAIGGCTSLEYLYVEANSFQGSLPHSMGTLRGIRDLDLSSNNFSGLIPRFLEQLDLTSLNLSFNSFEGEVPMGGIFKNASAVMIVGNNGLCGGLRELQLPKCAARSKKRHSISRVIVVVASICSVLVLAIALYLLFCWQRRKRQANQTGSSIMQSLSRVSYGSILKATDGFSQLNLIGTGSFGAVYKGIVEPIGAMVAVKVLKLENQGALKSFVAECEALKNIRHRNLVKIITSCSSVDYQGNDFKALVYEFMPNGNLESWLHPSPEQGIEARRLSLGQRVAIATDVAHAVHYLHRDCEVPIIHCDLKPSNILLDDDMVAHIGDFGLARFLPLKPPNRDQTSSNGIRGTVGYAAPEYGVGSEMSREGDVYSFGVVLLEMITGKRPTDLMFQEGLNLHGYVKQALPDWVMEIVEPGLMEPAAAAMNQRLEERLILLARIGLGCSMESPKDRMDMSNVIIELQKILN